MIKLVCGVRRRADLSVEEFQRYWFEQHAPLMKRLAKDLGVLRYVQSHSVAPGLNAALRTGRGFGEAYDGVVELWYESLDAWRRGADGPAGREAGRLLVADEAKFIDAAASCIFWTEEHEIFDFTAEPD